MSDPPNKAEREVCWNSRDNYFKCLDDNNEDKDKCKKLNEVFEKECRKAWIKHFIRRRDYLKYKEKLETGGGYMSSQEYANMGQKKS